MFVNKNVNCLFTPSSAFVNSTFSKSNSFAVIFVGKRLIDLLYSVATLL